MNEEDAFEDEILELENRIEALSGMGDDAETQRERDRLEEELRATRARVYSTLTPWQKTMVARHPKRPYTLDYIGELMDDFVEIHGDRKFADDPAIVCGLAASILLTPRLAPLDLSAAGRAVLYVMVATIGYAASGRPANWLAALLKKAVLGSRAA